MEAPKLELHLTYLGVTLYVELHKGSGRQKKKKKYTHTHIYDISMVWWLEVNGHERATTH